MPVEENRTPPLRTAGDGVESDRKEKPGRNAGRAFQHTLVHIQCCDLSASRRLSLMPPTVLRILPSTLSILPSVLSFSSPIILPAASFAAPLPCWAIP